MNDLPTVYKWLNRVEKPLIFLLMNTLFVSVIIPLYTLSFIYAIPMDNKFPKPSYRQVVNYIPLSPSLFDYFIDKAHFISCAGRLEAQKRPAGTDIRELFKRSRVSSTPLRSSSQPSTSSGATAIGSVAKEPEVHNLCSDNDSD